MAFAFDLISDLHIETWPDFDWTGQPTSPYCVVAGDVARDPDLVVKTLQHLGSCYSAVFYIDGNDEHRNFMTDLSQSYENINFYANNIPNVVYMRENVVIVNGVAFLAVNGWWTYDFDCQIDTEQSISWYGDYISIPKVSAEQVMNCAFIDARYMYNSIRKLQKHREVKSIVIITHTVPGPWLIEHDIELSGTHRFNCLGNNLMQKAIQEDSENKIKVWCFGHYHRPVDQNFLNIRFVNNCKGRGNSPWCQPAYYPKRIEI